MSKKELLFKDFKLPYNNVKFVPDEINENYGRFIGAPFERGYGITIANSLKKTLLTSIQGYAITAIRLSYLNKNKNSIILTNEFDKVYGMKDEPNDFVQNLKQVKIKLLDNVDNYIIKIEKKGDNLLRAKDLEVDSNIKILNPDLYLAKLNSDCELSLELQVDKGTGYVPMERHPDNAKEKNTILIDAIFTPVLNVKYDIENYRVGQRTDYDKIILEVLTDGTIKPDEVVTSAAKILRDYFSYFINFEEKEEEIVQINTKKQKEHNELDDKPIEDLQLSVRSSNCLRAANINTLGELKNKSIDELEKIKNLGKKSLNEIIEILTEYGYELNTNPEDNN